MSFEKQFVFGNDGGSPQASAEHPTCSQCRRRMSLKQISPVLFASGIDDVVYGCERCGTESKRTIKRS